MLCLDLSVTCFVLPFHVVCNRRLGGAWILRSTTPTEPIIGVGHVAGPEYMLRTIAPELRELMVAIVRQKLRFGGGGGGPGGTGQCNTCLRAALRQWLLLCPSARLPQSEKVYQAKGNSRHRCTEMLLLDDGTPAGIEALPRIPLAREANEATCSLVRLGGQRSCRGRLSVLCGAW